MNNIKKYAKVIIEESCEVKKGENVLIIAQGLLSKPLVIALIDEVYRKNANPFVELEDLDIKKQLIANGKKEQMEILGDITLDRIKSMDVMIVISALENQSHFSDVSDEKMNLYNSNIMQKCFFGYATQHCKWIFIKYPTNAMAQLFQMSSEVFENYYYDVCFLDYKKMAQEMDKLVELMEATDRVRILDQGTDIEFSIKGIGVAKSCGKNGLPDGEVFTAPVKDSANGFVSFNCPLYFRGTLYEKIRLELRNGQVIKAEASNNDKFNELLTTDEGVRYFGEFALGLNPKIKNPMKDILFDEKIMGSYHFALGNAYYNTSNGNNSSIHMDIVSIQTPEYGGGEIYFDEVLVRKDGKFVLDDLSGLNYLE
jgi:aminopeptidase